MELEENNVPEEQDNDYVEIYSRRAIFWFAVLASPIFGGVLLGYNLWAAGYKKALYIVGVFSVLYTVICNVAIYQYVLINKINLNVGFGTTNVDPHFITFGFMSMGLRLIGGFIFTQYFFRKYFPEDDYYPKSIFTALFATIFVKMILAYIGALFQLEIIF